MRTHHVARGTALVSRLRAAATCASFLETPATRRMAIAPRNPAPCDTFPSLFQRAGGRGKLFAAVSRNSPKRPLRYVYITKPATCRIDVRFGYEGHKINTGRNTLAKNSISLITNTVGIGDDDEGAKLPRDVNADERKKGRRRQRSRSPSDIDRYFFFRFIVS